VIFIDGNDLRVAELGRIAPGFTVQVEPLSTGFSTSAPEPGQRARDKLLAHHAAGGCFAEAVDLVTVDAQGGHKSLRLELDSENANRFCKWWRETPVRLLLVIALRRAADDAITVVTASCDGRIADQPRGPLILGWDRLFVPSTDNPDDATLAELTAAGALVEFRRAAYADVARALS
jgi:hypothetical protein